MFELRHSEDALAYGVTKTTRTKLMDGRPPSVRMQRLSTYITVADH
jgi:hypothetical protein